MEIEQMPNQCDCEASVTNLCDAIAAHRVLQILDSTISSLFTYSVCMSYKCLSTVKPEE